LKCCNGFYHKGVRIASCALALLAIAISACSRRGAIELAQQATGGDVELGEHLIYTYGSGTCHVIPGVAEANGRMGPTSYETVRRRCDKFGHEFRRTREKKASSDTRQMAVG
jgi:hypothetical protein